MNDQKPDFFDNFDFDSLLPRLTGHQPDPDAVRIFAEICAPRLEQRGLFFGLSKALARAWAERSIEAMIALLPRRLVEVQKIGLRQWVLTFTARMILPPLHTPNRAAKLGRDLLAMRASIDRWITHLSPLQRAIIEDDLAHQWPNDARIAEQLGMSLPQIVSQREAALTRLVSLMMGDDAVRSILLRLRADKPEA